MQITLLNTTILVWNHRCKNILEELLQWRNYYGLRPGEPGDPQPQWAKWGPPGLGDRAKTLARASLICYNVVF
jgi:hypothetical protein